jgi:hypothetical protein
LYGNIYTEVVDAGNIPGSDCEVSLAVNSNIGDNAVDLSSHTLSQLESVSNFVWHRNNEAKIAWTEDLNLHPFNLKHGSLNANIYTGEHFTSVNSNALNGMSGKSATISFYNVDEDDCDAEGIIYSPSGTTKLEVQSAGELCRERCTGFSYAGGECRFSVSGFSGYAVGGNANLTINDSAEGSSVDVNTSLTYYAYYRDLNGNYLNPGSCNATDNGGTYVMTDNDSYYSYTKASGFTTEGTKNWNVTCVKSGFTMLFANDTILVEESLGQQEGGPVPEFGTYAMFLILTVVAVGYFAVKRKEEE